MNEEGLTNINAILSTIGLRHTLHLYTPNVNKYTIQVPFLGSASKDEKLVYVTAENFDLTKQELKGLANLTIIPPNNIHELKGKNFRIVLDADSLSQEEYLKIENWLAKMSKSNFILCTYDVSKLKPEFIKELVKKHDKLALTTSDLTILSSEKLDELELPADAIEKFVKNDLETIVLAMILNKPMCGTDIIKTVHKEFNILLSPGTIYPLLHSLEEKGLLKCEYQVKTKLYKPPESAKPKIRSILNETVQASKFLSKFLQSIELSAKTDK